MIISEQYLKELLQKHYNMEVSSIEKILGYEDQNFLIHDAEGRKLIAKAATDLLDPYFLEAQLKAMAHLRKKDKNIRIQNVLANLDGGAYTVLDVDGKVLYLRVLSYLDGTFMGDLKDCPPGVLESLGSTLANTPSA